MVWPLGNYFVDRDQPALSSEDEEIVRKFSELYYRHWLESRADTINLSWFGYGLMKCPLDLWIYQELLVRTRPDVVVETGTWCGGSALYLAMLFDHLGHGQVVTVDVSIKPNRPEHPRIKYIVGSSLDPVVLAQVREAVGRQRALVILDSDHSADHVYQEMIAYSPLVQAGDYLLVEDTNINGHPAYGDFGPGPMEALDRFLSENDEFEIDRRCERFLVTMQPKGFLRRKGKLAGSSEHATQSATAKSKLFESGGKLLSSAETAKLSLEIASVPPAVGVSEIFRLDAIVKNGTDRSISSSPPFPVRLCYHWLEEATRRMVLFEGYRSELYPGVPPNATIQCSMVISAPDQPGNYVLQTTMVQEGVCWFEEVSPGILREFAVLVTPGSAPPSPLSVE